MKKINWSRTLSVIGVLLFVTMFSYSRVPMFFLEPSEDLWWVAAEKELSFVNKIRADLLLQRGADLSYEIAGTTPFKMTLRQRNYEMLSLMAQYVSDAEKQYALTYAETEGDAELLIFLRSNFDY